VTRGAQRIERNSLVMQKVNCGSILNKSMDFCNSIYTYTPDAITGMESWLREEISNAQVFRNDYVTYRRDRNTQGGGMFFTSHHMSQPIWASSRVTLSYGGSSFAYSILAQVILHVLPSVY
jgi:hypothetical protein